MEDALEVLLLLLVGGGTLVLLAISPVGRALAERLRARVRPPTDDQAAIHQELAFLRRELTELEARMDFTERLLAGDGAPKRLAPPPVEE